jgi:hypothetical protein
VPAYVSVTQGGFSFEFVFQRLSSKELVSFSWFFSLRHASLAISGQYKINIGG